MPRYNNFVVKSIYYDNIQCHVDVDECIDLTVRNPCGNGLCKNTNGSYECFCPPGYVLDSSGKFCVG